MTDIYRVECPTCNRPFNAMTAAACACIDRTRTLRCPNCAACFCRAPQHFKTQFWRNAPHSLYERLRSQPTLPDEAPNDAPSDVKRPLVLFADDDASGRAIARRVITAAGFGAILASTGDDALRLALEYAPELLISDAFMPGMDGREVAVAVRTELPDTKIIIISGIYKDMRYRHEAMRTFKVDDYVAKPLSPADLRELLTRYLSQ